jgi:zinc finger homeobox protein 2
MVVKLLGFLTLQATTVEMTFMTKVLPEPTLSLLEDGPEPPTPGPEPALSKDQAAGKEGDNTPPKVADKGTLSPWTKKG